MLFIHIRRALGKNLESTLIPQPSSSVQLEVVKGIPMPYLFVIDKPSSVLGKGSGVDVMIANPYVSRQHAAIDLNNGAVTIRDLGSKNGTLVDGKVVNNTPTLLENGSSITLGGGHVVLKFSASNETLLGDPVLGAGSNMDTGRIWIDSVRRRIFIDGVDFEIALSARDFEILGYLWSRRNELCDYVELSRVLWPNAIAHDNANTSALRTRISRIKQSLKMVRECDVEIRNIHGSGYILIG